MGLALRAPGVVLLILGLGAIFDGGALALLGLLMIVVGIALIAHQANRAAAREHFGTSEPLRFGAAPPSAHAWSPPPPPTRPCTVCGRTCHDPVCPDCHNAFVRNGPDGLEFRRFLVAQQQRQRVPDIAPAD